MGVASRSRNHLRIQISLTVSALNRAAQWSAAQRTQHSASREGQKEPEAAAVVRPS